MTRDIRKAIKRGYRGAVSRQLAGQDQLSGKELKFAYDAGDKLVTKIVHRAAKLAGIGIGSLLNVFGPEMVVLGGGVVEAFGDDFVSRVESAARDIAFDINSRGAKITRAELGDDAGVIGAAMLACESLKGKSKK